MLRKRRNFLTSERFITFSRRSIIIISIKCVLGSVRTYVYVEPCIFNLMRVERQARIKSAFLFLNMWRWSRWLHSSWHLFLNVTFWEDVRHVAISGKDYCYKLVFLFTRTCWYYVHCGSVSAVTGSILLTCLFSPPFCSCQRRSRPSSITDENRGLFLKG